MQNRVVHYIANIATGTIFAILSPVLIIGLLAKPTKLSAAIIGAILSVAGIAFFTGYTISLLSSHYFIPAMVIYLFPFIFVAIKHDLAPLETDEADEDVDDDTGGNY